MLREPIGQLAGARGRETAIIVASLLIVACGSVSRPQGAATDGIVVSGGYSNFFSKSPPGTCKVLINADGRTPGRTLSFETDGPDGRHPFFWFSVYPYHGAGTYRLSEPMQRGIDGVIAAIPINIDDGLQEASGSITVSSQSAAVAEGTVDMTMKIVGIRANPPTARVAGAWACQIVFTGQPSPPS